MVPTLGGVHKIQILIRDLLKDLFYKKSSAKKCGGSGGPRPLIENIFVETFQRLIHIAVGGRNFASKHRNKREDK